MRCLNRVGRLTDMRPHVEDLRIPCPQMMDTEELKAPLSELTRALSGLTQRLVAVEETNRASAGQMAVHAGRLQGWLALSSAFVS